MIAFENETRKTLDGLTDPIDPAAALPSGARMRAKWVGQAVNAFYERDRAVHAAWEALAANRKLSVAGKQELRDSLRSGWRKDGPGLAQEVMRSVRAANSRDAFKLRYPAPWPSLDLAAHEGVRQAILRNARTDVWMLLDSLKDDAQVVPRMAAIAEHGSADMAYLLLATPWARSYLQARFPQAKTPGLQWEHERKRLAPRFLEERDAEEWRALDRLAYPLYSVAVQVRQDLHYANQHLGVTGAPDVSVPDAPEPAGLVGQ